MVLFNRTLLSKEPNVDDDVTTSVDRSVLVIFSVFHDSAASSLITKSHPEKKINPRKVRWYKICLMLNINLSKDV